MLRPRLAAVLLVGAVLSEAQVAAVLNAIDRQQIDMADYMAGSTQDGGARAFAAGLIERHEALDRQVAETASRLGLRGEDSPLAASISREGAAELEKLRKQSEPARTRTYLADEAVSGAVWRRELDESVAPAATRPELAALVERARAEADRRVSEARRLQQSVEKR